MGSDKEPEIEEPHPAAKGLVSSAGHECGRIDGLLRDFDANSYQKSEITPNPQDMGINIRQLWCMI